ncbi:DNA-binding MarR family transcriptional regulator [Arthrobacter sp. PL16]|uniref:MarR family winged helix-turn-helix transcriptional regulator n=1 Tax=Arthrobacter sp. PL16 TaxID=3071720 RepID=UPI002DFC168F|nr:DNA-binding MarR family transcriptional regulator [Arthrobacter sp. PL16]
MDTSQWTTSRLLSTAARMNDHHQDQRLTDLDITHVGATTLEVLSDNGPITQVQLATLVHVQAQSIGRVLERLEFKGLVSRTRDALDSRSIRTRITARGRTLLHRIDQLTNPPAESSALSDQILRNQLIAVIKRLEATPA